MRIGHNRVLRLQHEGDAQDLSRLHHQKYSQSTDTLHSLGEELFIYVRTPIVSC